MLLLRQLTSLTRFTPRFFAAHKATQTMAHLNPEVKQVQVHQEMLRHINPYARINIRSDILLKVCSADVHAYPAGDAFIAELHGPPTKNCTATMKIEVSDDEKHVDVEIAKVADSDFYCELAVPIRADLHINSKEVVNVLNMYGEQLCITALKDIRTKDIRATKIELISANGKIKCDGLLLGAHTNIQTQAQGSISLDKLQGAVLHCKTTAGNISTKSCYVDDSTFETDTGCLQLKNIHKKTSVCVHKIGDLTMTGVNANINVNCKGGNLSLQLSQLAGENSIIADGVNVAKVNISDNIEENSYIDIKSANVTLESSLSHLSDCLSVDKQNFRMSTEADNETKLLISTKGPISLGKLSWADSMRAVLNGVNDDDK